MLRKHALATALGFLALLGAVEVANARIYMVTFSGSRGQVSAACTGANRHLMEGTDILGVGFTMCLDFNRGTSVICDDGGDCVGSYGDKPERPGRGVGGRGGRMAAPAESLVGSGGDPAPAPAPVSEIEDLISKL